MIGLKEAEARMGMTQAMLADGQWGRGENQLRRERIGQRRGTRSDAESLPAPHTLAPPRAEQSGEPLGADLTEKGGRDEIQYKLSPGKETKEEQNNE